MHYSLAQDGTDATIVQVSLELSDPTALDVGLSFSVDILPPSSGQPEFVILRSRFEAAVVEKWSIGDACVAYWQTGSADGYGGEWWRGKVVGDRREGVGVGDEGDVFGGGGCGSDTRSSGKGPSTHRLES